MTVTMHAQPHWRIACDTPQCGTQTWTHAPTAAEALKYVGQRGWTLTGGKVTCPKHSTKDGASNG